MITPTVHSNGDTYETLRDQYLSAYRALRAAADALRGIAPNARNYYVQGDGVFQAAVQQHQARVTALRSLIQDILAEFQAIEQR